MQLFLPRVAGGAQVVIRTIRALPPLADERRRAATVALDAMVDLLRRRPRGPGGHHRRDGPRNPLGRAAEDSLGRVALLVLGQGREGAQDVAQRAAEVVRRRIVPQAVECHLRLLKLREWLQALAQRVHDGQQGLPLLSEKAVHMSLVRLQLREDEGREVHKHGRHVREAAARGMAALQHGGQMPEVVLEAVAAVVRPRHVLVETDMRPVLPPRHPGPPTRG
mmetsp:Transcript_120607/g.237105  ORF Transcript_120607/g.237105 Transcript_120607/m.237105 type:complete len:222 (-) Transcript_120607:440-1105(-)